MQKRKRAAHTKARTGCLTCKIRRVRCDEGKPACDRCQRTGRKCDGYAPVHQQQTGGQSSSSPSSSSTAAPEPWIDSAWLPISLSNDSRLQSLRINRREMRSYRYFLDVVGPVMPGLFDMAFWLVEIPRACLVDAALWHAIVGLGVTHELRSGRIPSSDEAAANVFALQQTNTAIHWATSPGRCGKETLLVISTIFASMALLQAQYEQAMLHLRSGCGIVCELGRDEMKPVTKGSGKCKRSNDSLKLALPIAPIRNMLMKMEHILQSIFHGGLLGISPVPHLPGSNLYNLWRSYRVPERSEASGPVATPDSILAATRASESLLKSMAFSLQQHGEAIRNPAATADEIREDLAGIVAIQKPLFPGYKKLRRALQLLERELESSNGHLTSKLRHAIIPLRLNLAACYLIFTSEHRERDIDTWACGVSELCKEIIKDCRTILSIDETYLDIQGSRIPFTPNTTVAEPLFTVAHSGRSLEMRREAASLIQRPQAEAIWFNDAASTNAHAVVEGEVKALEDFELQPVPGSTNLSELVPIPPEERGRRPSMLEMEGLPSLYLVSSKSMLSLKQLESMEGSPGRGEWLLGPWQRRVLFTS